MMRNRKRTDIRKSCNDEQVQHQQEQGLLGGLPEHVAQLVLSRVHNPSLLYSVCRRWRDLIYSPCFPAPPFLSLYAIVSSPSSPSSFTEFFCFDPISQKWSPFPSSDEWSFPSLATNHPSFVARELPIQSLSVCDRLVVVAGTTRDLLPAISRPLIFNPLTKQWRSGPPIATPRRWCAAGSIRDTVYLASGVGSAGYNQDVARSVEKWVLNQEENCDQQGEWDNKVATLNHGRFSREAVEAVGWRGKLCVVNLKGNVVKEGVLYDQEKDRWQEMPQGMLNGWNGPTASDEDETVMYSVDNDRGALMRYDEADAWEVVVEHVHEFKGAIQVSARGGRVCVLCGGGGTTSVVVVVDVITTPPKLLSILHPPLSGDRKFVSVHVLPRMPTSVIH